MSRIVKSTTSFLVEFARKEPLIACFVYPASIGIVTGSMIGGYAGFVESRQKDYVSNVTYTIGGIFMGCGLGMFTGVVWPVSISVAALRAITPIKK